MGLLARPVIRVRRRLVRGHTTRLSIALAALVVVPFSSLAFQARYALFEFGQRLRLRVRLLPPTIFTLGHAHRDGQEPRIALLLAGGNLAAGHKRGLCLAACVLAWAPGKGRWGQAFFPDLAIFSAALEAFDGKRPDCLPAGVRARLHAPDEGMVAVRGEPGFDAGNDLPDALVADAERRGDLRLRFTRGDIPFIDFAIAPCRFASSSGGRYSRR